MMHLLDSGGGAGDSVQRLIDDLLRDSVECIARESGDPVSDWLRAAWQDAASTSNESRWKSVPEDILDRLEEGEIDVDEGDLAFLASVVATRDTRSRGEVRSAIRLLGGIGEGTGERRYAPLDRVRPYLTDLLSSNDAGIRVAAAEAIWQTGDRAARRAVEAALLREREEHARTTMEHVLRVLR